MEDFKQIKPKSILDPEPLNLKKIKPDSDANNQIGQNLEQAKAKKSKRDFNLKLPKLRLTINRKAGFTFSAAAFLVFLILLAAFLPAFLVYKNGKALKIQAQELVASAQSQDINKLEEELLETESAFNKFDKSFRRMFYLKYVPFVRDYYLDGEAGLSAGIYGLETAKLGLTTIKPYADIIGFGGESASSGEESANDRIEFIVQTIEGVLPQIDEIAQKANLANAELQKIEPDRYPEKIKGIEIRDQLKKILNLAEQTTSLIADSKPLLEATPYLLGTEEKRTYLLLFQNDKELRPTGGFLTAYSIMEVENGKLNQVRSSDIYDLDNAYVPSVKAPDPIIDYLEGPYKINPRLRLRDMNWDPDFKNSMELFTSEAKKAGITNIDGVIAVDTQVVVYLLQALGEIGVPGYGNFSAKIDPRCDCPQVVYELESFADVEGPIVWSENEPGKIVYAPENYDQRKKIIGPLMNSIIGNALGQEKEKMPALFEAAWKSVVEKHVLIYMFEEDAQAGVESFNLAGRMQDTQGDYLYVNDANLGGRKSNLYVTHEVNQLVEISDDGTVTKTVTLTYKNPKEYDGWLNSVLPNWTRVYVPLGSELVDVSGFDDPGETYEENGKTVFSGGFELRPEGVKKIILTYKLPMQFEGEFDLLVQKQPGKHMPLYRIEIDKKSEELFLLTDKEFKFEI